MARLLASLALLFTFLLPTALAAMGPPSGMACCKKSVHACCKRRNAHPDGVTVSAPSACKGACTAIFAGSIRAAGTLSQFTSAIGFPDLSARGIAASAFCPPSLRRYPTVFQRPPPAFFDLAA